MLALFERNAPSGSLRELRSAVFASAKHESLEEILSLFLDSEEEPTGLLDAACFGVAGAVIDGRVFATNLPWSEASGSAPSARLLVLSRGSCGCRCYRTGQIQRSCLDLGSCAVTR